MIAFEYLFGGHRRYPHRAQPEEIVDIVEIVRRLLQEQATRFGLITIPVVIVDTSIGHIVVSLHMLDSPDLAGVDYLFRQLDQRRDAKRKGHNHLTGAYLARLL